MPENLPFVKADETNPRPATAGEIRARQLNNRRMAKLLARAGLYLVPVDPIAKAPIWGAFQFADDDMSVEAMRKRADYLENKQKEGKRPSAHLGSTRTWKHLDAALKSNPDLVVGVVGRPNGLVVIDLDRHKDGEDGVAVLDKLFAEAGETMPNAPIVTSQSGGRHVYFKMPDGVSLGNHDRMFEPGVNVRGLGGQVLAPGMIRPDGKRYVPLAGSPDLATAFSLEDIPTLPTFLVDKITAGRAAEKPVKEGDAEATGRTENPEKDAAALSHAREIIAARKAGTLPTEVGLADVLRHVRCDAPTLLEPYDVALVNGSDARLEAARILRSVNPAATVLDFAGLLAHLPGVGRWEAGTSGAGGGVYNDRSIGRDWYRVTAEERPLVIGEGFGAVVDDDEPAAPLGAAWEAYRLAAEAGATADIEPLIAAMEAAGASRGAISATKFEALSIDPILSSDEDNAAALAAIGKTVAKLSKKAAKGETGKGVVVKSAVDFIREYKPMKTRVGKIIRAGYLYTLSGKTGHGKTSFMTALALALALGRADIIGLPVKQCRVIYATFENPDDFRIKLAAACSYHGVDLDALHGRFDVIDASTSPEGMTKAVATMGDVECVVIDTLQAAFDGKEFNANEEVLRFVRRLRPITRLPGLPTVIVPAHPNKAIDKAEELVPYGGGSIMNEVDGNLTLWRDAAGVLTLSCNKLRGPHFEPLKFRIEAPTFDTIRDDDGDPMSIPVALPITAEEAARDEVQARSVREEVLLVVVAEPEGNTRTWGEKLHCSKTTITNHLKALAADKQVKQDAKGRWTSTLKGEEEVAAIRRRETGGFGPVEDDDEAA